MTVKVIVFINEFINYKVYELPVKQFGYSCTFRLNSIPLSSYFPPEDMENLLFYKSFMKPELYPRVELRFFGLPNITVFARQNESPEISTAGFTST